jgi:hypothetical protein
MIIKIIFIALTVMLVAIAFKRHVWPRIPILPGLFKDINHGWSYDENGKRLTPSMFESPYSKDKIDAE